ncbi:MAG: hypothetical protein H7175_14090, partial [Burkholderiales bacterium]|nr:hypothetical protein [Anaerolineae bacterium]
MDTSTPLPTNETLIEFSTAVPWREMEQQKRQFNKALAEAQAAIHKTTDDTLDLDQLSQIVGVPVTSLYDLSRTDNANVLLAEVNGKRYVLGSAVSARYRSGKSLLESIGPYNLNPSVNHTNLHETDEPMTKMRHLGAEIELGLVHADGVSPSEDEMQAFIQAYYRHGLRAGIYPHLDREACQYQVEAHIAPSIGYEKTRKALEGIMTALVASGEETHLRTAVLSSYPTESDFRTTDHP